MSVQFETQSSFIVNASGVNIVLGKPPGVQIKDLMLALIHVVDTKPTDVLGLAGWVSLFLNQRTGATTRPSLSALWRLVDGGEGSTFTFPFNNSDLAMGVILRFSGADQSTPIDTDAVAFNNTGAEVQNFSNPAVTPTALESLLVLLTGSTPDFSNGNPGVDVVTPPAGFTERIDQQPNSGAAMSVHTKDALVGPGSVGPFTIIKGAFTGLVDDAMATIAIASAPAAGGGGTLGGDNPSILAPSRERIERGQKILNPFGAKKRHCMCPVGKCTCL